jgi:cyclophilin family peptidyl-prolyl cis-trans isomerase
MHRLYSVPERTNSLLNSTCISS